jgi:hypothetical protein
MREDNERATQVEKTGEAPQYPDYERNQRQHNLAVALA